MTRYLSNRFAFLVVCLLKQKLFCAMNLSHVWTLCPNILYSDRKYQERLQAGRRSRSAVASWQKSAAPHRLTAVRS